MQLVDVASQCYDMGNFNTLMEIISGLGHSSVKRLKARARARVRPHFHFLGSLSSQLLSCFYVQTAWKGLGDRHQRRFEELEQLMSPRNNFNDYRYVPISISICFFFSAFLGLNS
jgi:hypothetical protein